MTSDAPVRAVMWTANPIWHRLHAQPSWGRFLREMSLTQKVSLDVIWSHTGRCYHCQAFHMDKDRTGYQRRFIAEGFGAHPLGAVRDAMTRFTAPIAPTVRSKLLEALIDYLIVEIERHGLMDRIRAAR